MSNFVKKVRDRIKVFYPPRDECYITGNTTSLEVHHLFPISLIIREWEKTVSKSLDVEKKLEKLFVEHPELFDSRNCVVLHKQQHEYLHQLFGKQYTDVEKVRQWIEKRREKLYKGQNNE